MRNAFGAIKQATRSLLESTTQGYRFFLKRDHDVRGPAGRPQAPWHNAVLRTRKESNEAINQVRNLGLPLVSDEPKNWDTLAALDCILASTSKAASVLDAGAEAYSRILPWLCLYGYTRLDGINIVFNERKKLGPITYKYGDITSTDYAPETFDVVTCLSVIEHGVDLRKYFREVSRILKPGGILITSTDYWQTRIDTRGQQMFGVPVYVFTQEEILQAIEFAAYCGFALTAPIDLTCDEKVVRWQQVGLDYTFLIFTLRKVNKGH